MINANGEVLGKRGKILKGFIGGAGYEYVRLTLEENTYKVITVHKLLYISFIGDIPSEMVINHKDGVKTNNILENLELVTRSQNSVHSYETGLQRFCGNRNKKNIRVLTQIDIDYMFDLNKQGYSKKEIAEIIGTSYRTVSRYFSSGYNRKGIYKP